MSHVEKPQPRMVWPQHLLNHPPEVKLPTGYGIRTYQPGDENRFFEVMELAGWPGWNEEILHDWLSKIIPDGWFMILEESRGEIVATAMCLHNYTGKTPFWGNLGWLACDPSHTGKGLGLAASAAVTTRFIEAGYKNIDLYTEYHRLPALKTYLKLGYIPFLCSSEVREMWREVCTQLRWPFTPETWIS